MKIGDSFRLSVNSIMHRRLRAWLTLLGIIIGVAAVVAIISIGEGAQASINQRLSGFGADIITMTAGYERTGGFGGQVRLPIGGGFGGGGGQRGGDTRGGTSSSTTKAPELTPKDVSIIKGNPNVLAVNEIVSAREDFIFLTETTTASVQGVDPAAWTQTTNVQLSQGRLLGPSDSRAVVITDSLANSRFRQPITLGRKVTINSVPFTVVGILAPTSTGQGGFGGGGGNSTVYMPYTSAWDVTDVNMGTFSTIQVKVSSTDLVQQTVDDLTQSLLISRKVTQNTQDFTITSTEEIRAQVQSVTDTLVLFLGAIAAVSLVVGAIGVANSMFTSVLEKTKEVGIMKALGSTDNEILQLFLIESGLFGLIGGIIGVLLGTSVSGMINLIGGGTFTSIVTPQLFFIAIVMSTIIGAVAGVMPARSAAKMKPIDALRYE
ncbi:MacB-like periplasmic core domain protein [uncultured archaeon]|nr:MacB-like periplasmic core domain protein [uncultured archaeon]